MKQRCACDAYDVEANDRTYVRDFKPLCHEQTCARVRSQRERDNTYLRRAPFFDDIEHDRVAEPYGKSAQARFTDI